MKQEIRSFLEQTAVVGRELRYFEQLDSTNTYVKHLAQEGGTDGMAVVAGHQTAGRGRMDRTFQSPEGQGLYLTVLLRPELPPERLLCVTALAGVAVCRAVERLCDRRPGLKWPNDPVMNGRKLGGILTELVTDCGGRLAVVLGIGLNVTQQREDFSPDVAEMATSLLQEGLEISRARLAAALLEELDEMYRALLSGDLADWRQEYRRDCVNIGKTVQLIHSDGIRETAAALDIDEDFGLVVETEQRERKIVRTGEVSVRGLYGYVE